MGANPAVTGISVGYGSLIINGTIPTIGDYVTAFSPLVSDIPSPAFQGSGVAIDSLADIYSSGYRLRRIVGKIWVDAQQPPDAAGDCPEVVVTAGIIVTRTLNDGQPLRVGSLNDYSPGVINNWADPWVFRRSWKISVLSEAIAIAAPIWPENNGQYGSVADGPHVDQKTARIISSEERLMLFVAITASRASTGLGTIAVRVDHDLRFVASLRQNAGNRRNASR